MKKQEIRRSPIGDRIIDTSSKSSIYIKGLSAIKGQIFLDIVDENGTVKGCILSAEQQDLLISAIKAIRKEL